MHEHLTNAAEGIYGKYMTLRRESAVTSVLFDLGFVGFVTGDSITWVIEKFKGCSNFVQNGKSDGSSQGSCCGMLAGRI